MRGTGWVVALLAGVLAAGPARALSMSEQGPVAWLTGSFELEDGERFAAFLLRPRPAPLRVVYLNSYGGNLRAGLEIGMLIRRAGLATAVLADRHICDSACTLAFAGGVRRHNVNGGAVHEGHSAMTGLGFHPAHQRGHYMNPSTRSERGTQAVRAFYAAMGMPRAAELMDRAAINTMYRPSGQTSLDLRIATSLSAP